MAVATRAGCELLIGVENLEELARFGVDENEADAAAYATARIDNALAAADSWIASFFPATFDTADHPILVRYACEHAIYFLYCDTSNGADETELRKLQVREEMLFRMSKREVFVDGTTDGRRGVARAVTVKSGSKFRPDKMTSL